MAVRKEIVSIRSEARSVVRVDHVTETVEDGVRQPAGPRGSSRDVVMSGDVLLTPDWELRADAA